MNRFVPPCLLIATLAVSCAPPQAVCSATPNCPDGDVCRDLRCVPPTAPTIATIDGDGSARALDATGVDVPDGLAVSRRTRGGIVVTGTDLDAVDACRIEQNGEGLACELLVEEPNDGATVKRIALPAVLPGIMTLVLSGAAGEARAQVFLLQGEPGPQGPPGNDGIDGVDGAPGVDALIDVRQAGEQCAATGTGVLVVGGQDLNRNGVLDDDEIAPQEPLCTDANGAVDCADGVCTFTSPIDVPGITVAGRSVVTQFPAGTTFVNVPADEETIAAAIASLDDVRVPQGGRIRIQLAAGVHQVAAPILFTHPDGSRISITGAGRDATTIDAPSGFLILHAPLEFIDGFSIEGDGDSNGISAALGGDVVVERDVAIRGFESGVIAFSEGLVRFVPGDASGRALLEDNLVGANAADGGLQLGGVEIRNNLVFGVRVNTGTVRMGGGIVTGSPVGLSCVNNGVLIASEVDATGNDVAFEAFGSSYIEASGAIVNDNDTSFSASLGSAIFAVGAVGTAPSIVDASSVIAGP
jgi:hypothetical protein